MEWEIGQEVYIVPFDDREPPRSAKIGSIARKWITLDPSWVGKISKIDGCVQPQRGYSPRARAWPSKEAYVEHIGLVGKWNEFRRLVRYSMPEHLTEFDLDLMIDLVKSGDTKPTA